LSVEPWQKPCDGGAALDHMKERSPIHATGLAALTVWAIVLPGCVAVASEDVSSLLVPELQRSEIVGLVAGLGTTFAAAPDLVAMFKRRSSAGMNPRMAAITGAFQILWVYYGLLIRSRPVVAWNTIAVLINFLSVAAFVYFAGNARHQRDPSATAALSRRLPD
jgi:MtN3 and saliva related transmembrane protein